MSDAYIVGAGMIAFGRYPDRTYFSACRRSNTDGAR